MSGAAKGNSQGRVVLLLRGINVGGRHRLPMADLRDVLTRQLGCTDVLTYIQSGNAVFTAPQETPAASDLSAVLQERFGFPVPVMQRTAAEWHALVAANPLLSSGADAEFLHIVLLEEPLTEATAAMLQERQSGEEQWFAHGRELYLSLPHGVGRSKLALAMTSPRMPAGATMRNWRTVLQLQSML